MNENKSAAVLIGPPGSGKTTVVRALTADYRVSVIEAGNLLEVEVQQETPLGRQIKPYKVAGDLVPLDWVVEVISGGLKNVSESVVLFDGFPRSAEQLEPFLHMLKEHRLELCAVIVLTLDLATALERLGGRRICSECGAVYNVHTKPPGADGRCAQCGGVLIKRADDREEVIRRRFVNYERETVPVVEYFAREWAAETWVVPSEAPKSEIVTHMRGRLERSVESRGGGIRT